MQSNAMFAFVSVLCEAMFNYANSRILYSSWHGSIKQRSKTSFYLWDFRCSSVLPIINSVWKRTCRFMRFMRPFCSIPFSPPFYNDSNLDHKRCQWNLIFSVIIKLVQLEMFRILIWFLPIWNISFLPKLGKRWNCSLLSIVTKWKTQNMTFDEVQDPI